MEDLSSKLSKGLPSAELRGGCSTVSMAFLRLEGKHKVAKPEEGGKLKRNGEAQRRM